MRTRFAYRFNIVAGDQADVQVVRIGDLEFGPPPVGIVILEYVEYVILPDRQLFLGVGIVVVEGDKDVEERHGYGRVREQS